MVIILGVLCKSRPKTSLLTGDHVLVVVSGPVDEPAGNSGGQGGR